MVRNKKNWVSHIPSSEWQIHVRLNYKAHLYLKGVIDKHQSRQEHLQALLPLGVLTNKQEK